VVVRSGMGVMGTYSLDHWLEDVTIADVISNDWSPIQHHHILASFHALLTCLDKIVVWPIIYREPKEKEKKKRTPGIAPRTSHMPNYARRKSLYHWKRNRPVTFTQPVFTFRFPV